MYKLTLAIAAGCAVMLAQTAQTAPRTKERARIMKTATGTFEVKILPPAAPAVKGDFVRLSIDKTFAGGLAGTSRVEMLASGDGSNPAGGYVALERFTGKLDGRSGSFIMQHSGTMSPGSMEIKVIVTPGSGTGELEDISGTLEIRREGKQHFYTLQYELPLKKQD